MLPGGKAKTEGQFMPLEHRLRKYDVLNSIRCAQSRIDQQVSAQPYKMLFGIWQTPPFTNNLKLDMPVKVILGRKRREQVETHRLADCLHKLRVGTARVIVFEPSHIDNHACDNQLRGWIKNPVGTTVPGRINVT